MKQLIAKPTRYGNKPTTLDYILTNSDCLRDYRVKHLNISDHELVYVVRKKVKTKSNVINTFGRSYKNYDKEAFQQLMNDHDWSQLEGIADPGEYWEILINGITSEIEKLCPLKKIILKDYGDPWISREIVEVLKDKKRLFLKAKRSRLTEDLTAAREARHRANKMVKQGKEDFIMENLEDNRNDAKKFWEHVNNLLPKKSSNCTINLTDSQE